MKIINIVVNNPIFIELQYLTVKKYIYSNNKHLIEKQDFEYIVFNDGKYWPDLTNNYDIINDGKDVINKKCRDLNIRCINIPNEHHKYMTDIEIRHTESLNYVLNFMKHEIDEYLLLDSDMFIIDKLDLDIYRKSNFVGIFQERPLFNLQYVWPNFFYININKVKNIPLLNFSKVDGGDTGSASYLWLKSFNYNYSDMYLNNIVNDDFNFIKHLWSGSWNKINLPTNINHNILNFLDSDLRNINNTYFAEIYDNKILHYRAGTNWTNHHKEIHQTNIINLERYIKSL